MQVQTHILSSWCLGNLTRLTPKERLFCIVAGTLPDLDGIGIFFGVHYYQKYHHILGHNLIAGILISIFLAALSNTPTKAFLNYFIIFHLHLLLDLLGSGAGWGIYYFWPVSSLYVYNPYVWDFQSWQNTVCLFLFLIWMLIIAYRLKQTPLELVAPLFDKKCVSLLERFVAR